MTNDHRKRRMNGYDIHGIFTINSEVRLPELAKFRTKAPIADPMMTVALGKANEAERGQAHSKRMRYTEIVGPLGFWIDIELGDVLQGEKIFLNAARILKYSPHVLYTNSVEPILRWTFVKLGWALVHGACISSKGDAHLITARTDTGKTTTMLKILDQQRRGGDTIEFISDDLTLVNADGRVLTYPKPLTISAHTVHALNAATLTRGERFRLAYQSRLHSKSGRQTALKMSESTMPMATVNAIVQALVPPPKYHVTKLVPHAEVARESRLKGMFVIERGGAGEELMDPAEALQTLLENCDDAYGFPPYPAIKTFLHGERTGAHDDLRKAEHEIIAQALEGLPTVLIRSTTMDWAERLPNFMGEKRPSLMPRAEKTA